MTRTQVQIPDPLYREVKRVAALQDWSISEVFRRAAELLISQYPSSKHMGAWKLPEPRDMGAPLIAPDDWGDLLAEDETARA